VSSEACATSNDDEFDSAVGIGLFDGKREADGTPIANGSTRIGTRVGAGWTSEFLGEGQSRRQKAWLWVADSTQNPVIEGFKLRSEGDWNEPGSIILRGDANVLGSAAACKKRCEAMLDCVVGTFIATGDRRGECWLASKIADVVNTDFCDGDENRRCIAFEKSPTLKLRSCNAYLYEQHMVLPGGARWELNKFFATGTKFVLKANMDKNSDTLFGPVTVREVISKQFSYGKDTYVYWEEEFVNAETLHSKCVFTHQKERDVPKFPQWPGRVVGCDHADQVKYMSVHSCHDACIAHHMGAFSAGVQSGGSGLLAEGATIAQTGGYCHGFSVWKNHNLLRNGGFEEFETGGVSPLLYTSNPTQTEEAETQYAWVTGGPDTAGPVAILEKDEVKYLELPPIYARCPKCDKFLHLNGDPEQRSRVEQSVATVRGTDYLLSFWVSGEFSCTGGNAGPSVKTASVQWNRETVMDLAVDVIGWGCNEVCPPDPANPNVEQEGSPDCAMECNNRWKVYTLQVTAAGSMSTVGFEGTNLGCGGVFIDQVDLRVAHAAARANSVGNEECAQLGVDLDVEVVEQEHQLDVFDRADTEAMERLVCEGGLGVPEAIFCQDIPGTVLALNDQTRRYVGGTVDDGGDTSFVHVWGGYSSMMDDAEFAEISDTAQQNLVSSCTDHVGPATVDPMAPWNNPMAAPDAGLAVFFGTTNGGRVTVYTYRLRFGHLATILNIKVTGSKFEGSIFKLLSPAKTVIAKREVNTGDKHFNDSCALCGDCTVIVPGAESTAEKMYYFEETNTEAFGRIRSSFCVRTPACYLHAETGTTNVNAITGARVESRTCQDGLVNHVNSRDRDYTSFLIPDTCERVRTGRSQYTGATLETGPDHSVKFKVVHPSGVTNRVVHIGLFEDLQRPLVTYQSPPEDCRRDPSYFFIIDDSGIRLFGGWPGEGSPLASNTEMSGGQLLEGESFYMWIDMYERKSLQGSQWSLRMGRSISALSMDEMPVGGDVLLQYDVAPGRESMSFRHFTLYSEETADWHVCTTGAPGKPSMAKTARCEGGCQCQWSEPEPWPEMDCSSACGGGSQVRSTSCQCDSCMDASVICGTKGAACVGVMQSKNEHCKLTLYSDYAWGYGPDNASPSFRGGMRTNVYTTNDEIDNVDMESVFWANELGNPVASLDRVRSFVLEGEDCGVQFFETEGATKVWREEGTNFDVMWNADTVGLGWHGTPLDVEPYSKLVVNARSTEDMDDADIEPGTRYIEFPTDLEIISFQVTVLNRNFCETCEPGSESCARPVTFRQCENDEGCCYGIVYGIWGDQHGEQGKSAGSSNIQMVEGLNPEDPMRAIGCMNPTHECSCDYGRRSRDVRVEKRKYRCDEWVADAAGIMESYYLYDTAEKRSALDAALTEFGKPGGDGPNFPICAKKTYVQTLAIGSTSDEFYDLAHSPLTPEQYASGCPETVDRNFPNTDQPGLAHGWVSPGSCGGIGVSALASNARSNEVDACSAVECSAETTWFGELWQGDTSPCAAPVEASPSVPAGCEGFYPVQCEQCATKLWCSCAWQAEPWEQCVGCGDVTREREASCQRSDGADVLCTAGVLASYGSCCYQALYNPHCGGCAKENQPDKVQHCMDFSQCTYQWHVKQREGLCDQFVQCVSWPEWSVDERHQGSDEEKKAWCTDGPQRRRKFAPFVTYGLGACWLPAVRRYRPEFTTANEWGAGSGGTEDECQCYYGGSGYFGDVTFGAFPTAPLEQGTKAAQLFEQTEPGWITHLHVATVDGEDGTTMLKAAVYADNHGSPGQRLGISRVADATVEQNWVHLEMASFDPDQPEVKKGLYIAGGRYWLAVVVGLGSVKLLGTSEGAQIDGETYDYITATDNYSTGDESPSNPFGAPTAAMGGFSMYASFVADDRVHVVPYLQQPCTAAISCEDCMATVDNRRDYNGERCGWLDVTPALPTPDNMCQARSWIDTSNYQESESCREAWGGSLFRKLEGWSCFGTEMDGPSRTVGTGDDMFAEDKAGLTSTVQITDAGDFEWTKELCAEECHLANQNWATWSVVERYNGDTHDDIWAQDLSEGDYCEGYVWDTNANTCAIYSSLDYKISDAVMNMGMNLGESPTECYVQREDPNPCGWTKGTWVRDADGAFYYVARGGFLLELELVQPADATGQPQVPTCGGINVFGEEGATAPSVYCNGYGMGEAPVSSPADPTCNMCVQVMKEASRVSGKLNGSDASCRAFGTQTVKACQGQTANFDKCAAGEVISFDEQAVPATYGRLNNDFCTNAPGEFETASAALGLCGERGNVQERIRQECEGNQTCTINVSDEALVNGLCPTTFKYFEASYRCVAAGGP
jgi:hypothetical protein